MLQILKTICYNHCFLR